MANEITLNASLAYSDSEGTEAALTPIVNLLATVASKRTISYKVNVGITEEALPLGDVTTPGWAMFINRDETNFVELRVATGGAKFAKLKPGEFALLRLGSGAQAPYAIADTAACQLECLLIQT